MSEQYFDYTATIREAQRLRARAMLDFWRSVRETLSLHVPKLFPAEY